MKYNREDRVKILEYKFIFEEALQAQREFEEGAADLNYRLSFFREKLHKNSESKDQKKRYDQMFMGGVPKNNDLANVNQQPDKQEVTQIVSKSRNNVKPWVKKMYRQIVMSTHPDRISGIQSQHLKSKLIDQYRIAQDAYNKDNNSDLIMVAFDLSIDIPEGVVAEEIVPSSERKKKTINGIKEKIGWQWYHVPESQRNAELIKILHMYGFEFTEVKVSEVTKRKYVKRKVGTKPVNMRKQRNLKKTTN